MSRAFALEIMGDYIRVFFTRRHLRLLFKIYFAFMVLGALGGMMATDLRGATFGLVGFASGIGLAAFFSNAFHLYARWKSSIGALARDMHSKALPI